MTGLSFPKYFQNFIFIFYKSLWPCHIWAKTKKFSWTRSCNLNNLSRWWIFVFNSSAQVTHSGCRTAQSSLQDRNKHLWCDRSCLRSDTRTSPDSPAHRSPEGTLKHEHVSASPLSCTSDEWVGLRGFSYVFHRRCLSSPPDRYKLHSHGHTTHCFHTDTGGDIQGQTYLLGILWGNQTHNRMINFYLYVDYRK